MFYNDITKIGRVHILKNLFVDHYIENVYKCKVPELKFWQKLQDLHHKNTS